VNLIYFLISLALACIINFNIDLFTGSICLHTQSIWGVNIMKEVIVLLLSGATIPISFFPKLFQTVVYFLPFQAMYNAPLRLLIYGSLTDAERLQSIGIQPFWVVFTTVTAKLFLHASLKKITVNGG
jgi:ABC-2 type transport system permease protein